MNENSHLHTENLETDNLRNQTGGSDSLNNENDDDDDDDDDESEDDAKNNGGEDDEEEAEALLEKAKAKQFFDEDDDDEDDPNDSIILFSQLNLSRPIMRGVAAMGYTQPTPIQAKTIPQALAGKDVCGSAVTGSGKTGAFLLPILEKLLQLPRGATRALILAPTRELAAQCISMMTSIARFTDLTSCLIVGGAKNNNAQGEETTTQTHLCHYFRQKAECKSLHTIFILCACSGGASN